MASGKFINGVVLYRQEQNINATVFQLLVTLEPSDYLIRHIGSEKPYENSEDKYMEEMIKKSLIIFAFMVTPFVCNGESEVLNLSSELRTLLNKEMAALQDGMKLFLPAYISGDLEEVAHIAHDMKNSYILKQEITSDQKHELMSKLPESFLHLDQKFHDYAGMLEHVAKEQHLELVGFYYYKLTESCIGCHSQFAKHRFPNLISGSKQHSH